MAKSRSSRSAPAQLQKCPTGISGLDQITHGGLPRGRPTLVCGAAGCGKTLLATEFLVKGATQFSEPGVFMSFEETALDLEKNVSSLGFDLPDLVRRKMLAIDHVRVERSEIEETGEYDLEALFIRLDYAIKSVNAKRVVLDTIESLFGGLSNANILRAELRRLFGWLKDRGMTAVITGEKGEGSLTRQGLEEYVSDCVILLDHRVNDQVSTRRLRIVKYRGSLHGTNEYPFLIDEDGISVIPITAMGLNHPAPTQRISSGVPRLDTMLGGRGFYRGSSILISGTAGVGKTSLAAHFADAVCKRGEKCAYFLFEESPQQLIRNMRSIGLDLQRWVDAGKLRFVASRPTIFGLESHLATMHKAIQTFRPAAVIVDPVSNLIAVGSQHEAQAMVMRLVDYLKSQETTLMMTSLNAGGHALESTEIGISSLIDTWLLMRDIEIGGERNRGMYILKSRGMPHSNQIREFLITSKGIDLLDVYLGPSGVLTGSARAAREAEEQAEALAQQQEFERLHRQIEHKTAALRAQIAALKADLATQEEQARAIQTNRNARRKQVQADRDAMAERRSADSRRNDGRKTP